MRRHDSASRFRKISFLFIFLCAFAGRPIISFALHPERRRRALISNSLINSPFATRLAALCLCREASAERHTVDCGLASVFWLVCYGGVTSRLRRASPRRAPRRADFFLLFSTGWSLIVRAGNKERQLPEFVAGSCKTCIL